VDTLYKARINPQLLSHMQGNNKLITKNTCIFPYFGGLKDSPTCRHNLQEVTYP
jgi:hypothetical protein